MTLGSAGGEGTRGSRRKAAADDAGVTTEGSVDPNKRTDSALIAVVKQFSKRLAPPPPPPPKPPKPVETVKPPKPPEPVETVKPPKPPKPPEPVEPVKPPEPPKPPDPPKLPPKPKVPKPGFSVTGTIVIGEYSGLAWVMRKGKEKAFWVGETIDGYKIERVFDGKVELSREGATFSLEVPKPGAAAAAAAKAKATKADKAKAKRKRPRRRGRKTR